MEDINCLLLRRQVSLRLAEHAACEPARRAHQELADRYGSLILDHRDGASGDSFRYLTPLD